MGQHWFDLVFAIAFVYLASAVHKLRAWYPDHNKLALIEKRANFVIGMALALMLTKWLAAPSVPYWTGVQGHGQSGVPVPTQKEIDSLIKR